MRVGKLLTVSGIALTLALGACSSNGGPSAQSGGPITTEPGGPATTQPDGPTTSTGTGSSEDLCATVGKLGKSIAAIRGGSAAQSRAMLDALQQDYEEVKKAAAGEVSIEAGDIGQAMADLENGSGADRSRAAAKLARAYGRLDAATDCP
jgi:hypothetical protein